MSAPDDREPVPAELAIRMLKVVDGQVHTFRNPVGVLIGADWDVDQLKKAIRKHGVELSGASATSMKHGLAILDDHGPLFLETEPAESFEADLRRLAEKEGPEAVAFCERLLAAKAAESP
jgi:hypothetical protein